MKDIPTPYGFRENLAWLRDWFLGPRKTYRELTDFMDQDVCLHEVEPRLTMVFFGDVMPSCGKAFHVGHRLKLFLSKADYTVLNLEGVISRDGQVLNALCHHESVIGFLEEMLPAERTIVSCANNHAADCGAEGFLRSQSLLEGRGYRVIGTRERPAIVLNQDVQIAACTYWSNRPCDLTSGPKHTADQRSEKASFRILYPHWGYEMQLYPQPKQIGMGKGLLSQWDMIVGHHSHCPQPVARYGGKVIAYSLGNLCWGFGWNRCRYGLVVKAHIGKNRPGEWMAGRVEWKFTRQRRVGEGEYLVDIAEDCPFFPTAPRYSDPKSY